MCESPDGNQIKTQVCPVMATICQELSVEKVSPMSRINEGTGGWPGDNLLFARTIARLLVLRQFQKNTPFTIQDNLHRPRMRRSWPQMMPQRQPWCLSKRSNQCSRNSMRRGARKTPWPWTSCKIAVNLTNCGNKKTKETGERSHHQNYIRINQSQTLQNWWYNF